MKNLLRIVLLFLIVQSISFGQDVQTGYWASSIDGSFSIMDLSDASKTPVGTTEVNFSAGDFGDDNVLYAINNSNNGFYEIDTATGTATLLGTNAPPVNHIWQV